MERIKSAYTHARKKVLERPYLYSGIALLLIVGWLMFGRGGNGAELQTIAVVPVDFAPAVAVTGVVTAAQEVDLGFAQSGRVTGVYVSVGARVNKGATIANVENGDERAALASAQARLKEAETARPEEIRVAEGEVTNERAAAEDAVQEAYRAADDAVRVKTAELFYNGNSNNPTLAFITDNTRAKNNAESGRRTLEDTLNSWERELNTLSDPHAALARAQEVLTATSPFLTALASALSGAKVDAYNTQTEIENAVSNIATARSAISVAQSGLTSARSALQAAERALALARAGSTSYDIAYERAQVAAAVAQLARTIIVAPFSGTVSRVDVSVGEIVSPNTPQISMLSHGLFQIESFIPEVNVAALQVGDAATVTLDAYGIEEFEATVVAIDPAETVRDGVSTYKTTLQFKTEDPRIRSGMTANITIITDKKEGTLVVPQGALVRRNGKTYLQVLVDKKPIEREVTVGVTSLGQAEVVSGLTAGEVVVLNPAP